MLIITLMPTAQYVEMDGAHQALSFAMNVDMKMIVLEIMCSTNVYQLDVLDTSLLSPATN